jgi:PEP-CTERM motif-containing protein
MKWRSFLYGSVVTALLGLAVPANAAQITGTLGIGGSITYDTTNLAGGAILAWQTAVPPPITGGGTGPFANISSITDYFTPIPLFSQATILDITNDLTKTGVPGPALAPAGVPINVPNFLSGFVGLPGLHFDLTELPLQVGLPCPPPPLPAAQSCVEGPFLLSQTNQGVHVLFDVQGNFVNGADSGGFDGSFSTTFTNMTLAEAGRRLDISGQILACGQSTPPGPTTNNQQIPCSFDANFVGTGPAVPEPATLLMFGTGAALLARRLKKRKKA